MGSKENVLFVAKVKAYKLFEKFIKEESESEINISGSQRKALTDLFSNGWLENNDIEMMDLLLLFDDLINEMKHLLSVSWSRIRYQPEYQQTLLSLVPP